MFRNLSLVLLLLSGRCFGQEQLSPFLVKAIFNDSIKKTFNINFPIFRVYRYSDKSGEYYCVLTESDDSVSVEDTISHAIKAIDLKADQGVLTKVWEINDFIVKNENEETTIRFWTRFSEFKDYDGDGLIEPFIIYGMRTSDGSYDNGRIKFIIYYKGHKFAMRHQGSSFDSGRETVFDASYDSLPKAVRDAIDKKMAEIRVQMDVAW